MQNSLRKSTHAPLSQYLFIFYFLCPYVCVRVHVRVRVFVCTFGLRLLLTFLRRNALEAKKVAELKLVRSNELNSKLRFDEFEVFVDIGI